MDEGTGRAFLSPPYGQPSPFEKSVIRRPRAPTPTNTAASSMTPWQNLHGIITPNGLHFERHHAGVPAIDPDQHRLVLHGLVKRPLIFTMDDIVRFPLSAQPVDATQALNLSAGVSNVKVLRGRSLS